MSTYDVAQKKQTFFKPVTSEADRETLLEALVRQQGSLQMKEEGSKTISFEDLTVAKALGRGSMTVRAEHISGPKLKPCELTIVFDLGKAMYFCTGTLLKNEDDKCDVRFKKIYELQRRDAFRVNIPAKMISARFTLLTLNSQPCASEFRVCDLSAGGFGLAIPLEDEKLIPNHAEMLGILRIGNHPQVEIQARVKHVRKVTNEKPPFIHCGCGFEEVTVSQNQKLSYLVNECHRLSFTRILK